MDDICDARKPLRSASRKMPHLIWWLQGQERQNFGDYLTEFLWNNLAAQMRIPGDGYHLIGSTIADGIIFHDLDDIGKWEAGRVVFWCCGMRDENPLSPDSLARSVFCGVRGPLTRDALKLPAATPIGDPALILPLVHTPKQNAGTAGKTVCAPHFLDKNSDQHLLELTGADVIVRPAIANSCEALTQILDELASAEFVLAGSLHAAIAACAYGVSFCYFDDGNVDIPFKWRDFSASVNIGTFFVDNIAEGKKIYEAAIRPRLRTPLLFPILAAAPFRVHPELMLKAALHDAERLGKRDRIDVEALSLLVDLSDREESTASVYAELGRAVEKSKAAEREAQARAEEFEAAVEEAQAAESGAQARAGELEAALEKAQAAERRAQARAGELEAAVEKAQAAERRAQARAEALKRVVEEAQAAGMRAQARAEALKRVVEEAREAERRAEQRSAEIIADRDAASSAVAALQSRVLRLREEKESLARQLNKAFRRPWRPVKHFINHYSLSTLSILAAPISRRTAARLARSAEKRSPSRFEAFLADTDESIQAAPQSNFAQLEDRSSIEAYPEVDKPPAAELGEWVLMVELRIPMPENNSGSARMFQILKILLKKGYQIFFISDHDLDNYHWVVKDQSELEPFKRRLDQMGVGYVFGRDAGIKHLKEYGGRYTHTMLFYPDIAHAYTPWIRSYCPSAQVIFDCVDLHFLRFEREAKVKNDPDLARRANEYRKKETLLFDTSDVVIAISEEEKAIVRRMAPGCRVEVIQNVFEEESASAPLSERRGLLFIGHYLHSPNVDAVLYFVQEILPLVRAEIPDAEFLVVGSNMTDEVKSICAPDVRLVGFVENVKPIFDACRVFVAPLRYGAGIKGKVGQAMARGLPMVLTHVAAEGMGLENGKHALIEDDPARFAAAVVRLYRDAGLWTELSRNSREHIHATMSVEAAARKLESILGAA